MAYVHQTPEVDRALDALRRKITNKCGIAVTVGYGPRFLHSTGQLHKGGPGSGLFLQLTMAHNPDPAIPGTNYTFGLVADAQAAGDLEALLASNRRAARVALGPDPVSGIHRMAELPGLTSQLFLAWSSRVRISSPRLSWALSLPPERRGNGPLNPLSRWGEG